MKCREPCEPVLKKSPVQRPDLNYEHAKFENAAREYRAAEEHAQEATARVAARTTAQMGARLRNLESDFEANFNDRQ